VSLLDLEEFGKLGKKYKILTAVDSTFASPYNQKPINYGIDLVLHSATKYLGG
jgi:cystathionine beta-lyase/cystathionine gamma-synthase